MAGMVAALIACQSRNCGIREILYGFAVAAAIIACIVAGLWAAYGICLFREWLRDRNV